MGYVLATVGLGTAFLGIKVVEYKAKFEHITSARLYVVIFLALMALTAVTVWVAFQDLGPINDIVAMGLAVTKTILVILYFMHVRYSSRMTKVTVVAGFLWLAIMIGLTLTDYLSRTTILDTWIR